MSDAIIMTDEGWSPTGIFACWRRGSECGCRREDSTVRRNKARRYNTRGNHCRNDM